ncbi:T9SS type A sorting domain-containing protein [Ignavibacterium sp.]|nr:T9SS type A sorting domain-containing protein [Ignavibacterium sp.]
MEFNSSDLPSGIYYYKLTAGNFSDVKKMILLK